MKALVSLPVAVLFVSLAGCASSGQYASTTTYNASHSEIDYEYMSKVERVSRGRGVVVKWVNPPLKRRSPEQARPNE
jgi:hypothetical protein